MKTHLKEIGPGALVAAAFIGPGTVTTCTLAGASYGFTLVWTVVLSCLITLFLQYDAAKLGLVTNGDLATVIKKSDYSLWIKFLLLSGIFSAIVIGNLAYEAGNIRGAVLGLEPIFGIASNGFEAKILIVLTAFLAMGVLLSPSYKMLERILISMVAVMSLAFILAMILTKPNLIELFKALFRFEIPDNSLLTIVAVIGTTVVPYNIFLHSNLVRKKWSSIHDLPKVRTDTVISIILGGLISLAIVIVAASAQGQEIRSGGDLAIGLGTVFGPFATYLVSIGLFAAGLTSCITAPMAAAFVASNCFGWEREFSSKRFRLVWLIIIIVGATFALLGTQPIVLIQFAQVTNAIVLPVIVGILIWMLASSNVMGIHANKRGKTLLGIIIFLFTLGMSGRTIYLLLS